MDDGTRRDALRREAERARRERVMAMTPVERMEEAYRLFRLTREAS